MTKTISKKMAESIRDALTATARSLIGGKPARSPRLNLHVRYNTDKSPGALDAWRVVDAGVYAEDAEEAAAFQLDATEPHRITRDNVEQAMFEITSALEIREVA